MQLQDCRCAGQSGRVTSAQNSPEADRDARRRTDQKTATGQNRAGQATDPNAGPDSPADLPKRSWLSVLKGAAKEFSGDNLTDTAAALTYYAVLALFPGLLVLVSLIGLAGPHTTDQLIANIGPLVPGDTRTIIVNAIHQLQRTPGAGLTAIIGLATALWSASGYIGAFMRAANTVWDVPEGRPIWKTIPTRLGVTLVMLLMIVIAAMIVVFTGPLAEHVGNLIGLGDTAVTIWSIAKWPVLLVIMMLMVGILYWASPNAKQPGAKWVTPGGVFGVLIWLIASGLFAFYVANFGSYNKTYGALAGVVVFLVWIWISNIAILLGAELNAELDRAKAESEGLPEGQEPYVELRDEPKKK